MTSEFEEIAREIENGRTGKNTSVPVGFPKLNKYIAIRKKIMTLVFGSTGCMSKGTKVIMSDGSYRNVEDVKVGDELMGPDSQPRKVLELKRGTDQMYWIRQNKGIDYRVNSDHILHLRRIRKKIINKKTIPGQLHILANKRKRVVIYGEQEVSTVNISVKDILKKPKNYLHDWLGYKVGIDFLNKDVEIDPYLLGMWLGDGTSSKPEITSADSEVVEYIQKWASAHGCRVTKRGEYSYNIVSDPKVLQITGDTIVEYNSLTDAANTVGTNQTYLSACIDKEKIAKGSKWQWKNNENPLTKFLTSTNLLNNKHIPENYVKNSRTIRLGVLAGIIDSDGSKDENGGYSITLKSKILAEDVVYLSRSLGYYTSIAPKKATMKRQDNSIYECQVYRITINGNNLYEIPCIIPRKKIATQSTRVTDALSTGIKIEKDIVDEYYGFTLSGDNLFLLEDMTVTHNSGKSSFTYEAWILNTHDWWVANNRSTPVKVKPILFSFERSKIYTKTKWLTRKIYKDTGILIPIGKMLGWWQETITHDEHDLILMYEDYINDLMEYVTVVEGATNPTGCYRYIKDFAESRGRIEQISEKKKLYIPDNENEIVIPIIDHIGLIRLEKGCNNKKEAIDKLTEYSQEWRDWYGYSPVFVAQINRELGSVQYQKMGEFEPTVDQIKESGTPAEAADVILSLFDPLRYNTSDVGGYEARKFINPETGSKPFRSVKILKNTYGSDGIRAGMVMQGETGIFRELVKKDQMTEEIYNQVINGSYFSPQEEPQYQKKSGFSFGKQ